MSRYGPTKGEHRFRLVASLLALVLFGIAAWTRGIALNIVTVELGVITIAFFGGSALWSARALWRDRD
ncbi:hypothetical protein GQ651_16035 [Alphaproteobacteria bacterium GH1-50]|uniref:Uncharacterized protein n=1 Tax=Kangsaoukella pontilimi TaxID=2691042 RepID=A0A7C9MHZ3_9RHOB|nr:hypothetical protein [Kangsaoukella pontilimi]MXQ09356.1 hypothetical protein [Kangsaoukella pontilimi]